MPEESKELFEHYFKSRDLELRDQLICSYMDLVLNIAKRYAKFSRSPEDLYQVGYIGLIKALDSFQPSRQVQFSTYATHCITGELRHYIRDNLELVRRPRWLQKLKGEINAFMDDFLQQHQRLPGLKEISTALNIKEEGVLEVLKSHTVLSIEYESSRNDRPDFGKIKGLNYETFKLPIEDKILLHQALEHLQTLEKKVVYLFFYQDLTQIQIGQLIGMSHKKVSRLLQHTLSKLRRILSKT